MNIKEGKIDILGLINCLSKEEQLKLGEKIIEIIDEINKKEHPAWETECSPVRKKLLFWESSVTQQESTT